MVLVADRKDPKTGIHEVIGVGRLTKLPGGNEAEFAIVISDQFQGNGLGTELLRLLMQVGRDEKLRRITADILSENRSMLHLSKKLGFRLHRTDDNVVMGAEIDL